MQTRLQSFLPGDYLSLLTVVPLCSSEDLSIKQQVLFFMLAFCQQYTGLSKTFFFQLFHPIIIPSIYCCWLFLLLLLGTSLQAASFASSSYFGVGSIINLQTIPFFPHSSCSDQSQFPFVIISSHKVYYRLVSGKVMAATKGHAYSS